MTYRALPIFFLVAAAACSDRPGSVPTADDGVDAAIQDAGLEPDAATTNDAGSDASRDVGPDLSGPRPYPAADAWTKDGPGVGSVTYTAEELGEHCAYMTAGAESLDHHNLVAMWNGYLLMPWSPDLGGGGMSFFDFSDPCDPQEVGRGRSEEMRETHSLGFAHLDGRWWTVTDQIRDIITGGIQFWDITDPTAPKPKSVALVDGFFFPDAYRRVTLSTFWQVPYVFVGAAQNGVVVVDATDPENPETVQAYEFDPVAQVGQVHAIGNLVVATTSEGSRAMLLDASNPKRLQPIPGGDFTVEDETGTPREAYFSTTTGGYVFFARKDGGGGLIIYDIRDPENPTRVGGINSDGNGGYVFVKDEFAFVGEGRHAAIYDITDMTTPVEVDRLEMVGDLDTITPIANVVVLSVDDDPAPDRGSAVVPFDPEPDTRSPTVTWTVPDDGATGLATTSRVGLTFSEFIEPVSAFEGSVRLYEKGTDPAFGRVDGWVSAQETVVNFWPYRELQPDTTYIFELPAGGIADYAGNRLEETFTMEFTTR